VGPPLAPDQSLLLSIIAPSLEGKPRLAPGLFTSAKRNDAPRFMRFSLQIGRNPLLPGNIFRLADLIQYQQI
jgi:hypothetical protein